VGQHDDRAAIFVVLYARPLADFTG